jgi:hypothetical protein
MNYFNNRSFFIWVLNEALLGLKSGKYNVDENGVFLEDTYLNIIKFNLVDEEGKDVVKYLILSYTTEMNEHKLNTSDDLLGPGTDNLVENLYQEIQKKLSESGIKDKWGE